MRTRFSILSLERSGRTYDRFIVRSPVIFFFVFLGLVIIGLVTMGLILLAALGRGPCCPACRGATLPLRLTWLARRLLRLERRWCLDCGWEGLVLRGQPRRLNPFPADAEQPWPV